MLTGDMYICLILLFSPINVHHQINITETHLTFQSSLDEMSSLNKSFDDVIAKYYMCISKISETVKTSFFSSKFQVGTPDCTNFIT